MHMLRQLDTRLKKYIHHSQTPHSLTITYKSDSPIASKAIELWIARFYDCLQHLLQTSNYSVKRSIYGFEITYT
jgi:hypothetical protein